jgi:hypothetical protein
LRQMLCASATQPAECYGQGNSFWFQSPLSSEQLLMELMLIWYFGSVWSHKSNPDGFCVQPPNKLSVCLTSPWNTNRHFACQKEKKNNICCNEIYRVLFNIKSLSKNISKFMELLDTAQP